jgi:hypothetical protein
LIKTLGRSEGFVLLEGRSTIFEIRRIGSVTNIYTLPLSVADWKFAIRRARRYLELALVTNYPEARVIVKQGATSTNPSLPAFFIGTETEKQSAELRG